MTRITQSLFKTLHTSMLAALVLILPIAAQAAHHEEEEKAPGRAMALTVEAVVTAIDLETRHVSLQGPGGEIFTVNSPEAAVKLEDIKVGDRVVATYIAALEGELRAPTEEELAEPWVVIEDAAISEDPASPAIGGARVVRAVCTIEGMNRLLGTVVIKDPRGKVHVIADVEAEKMEGVTLGQTVVIVYAEALALSLKHAAVAE